MTERVLFDMDDMVMEECLREYGDFSDVVDGNREGASDVIVFDDHDVELARTAPAGTVGKEHDEIQSSKKVNRFGKTIGRKGQDTAPHLIVINALLLSVHREG